MENMASYRPGPFEREHRCVIRTADEPEGPHVLPRFQERENTGSGL